MIRQWASHPDPRSALVISTSRRNVLVLLRSGEAVSARVRSKVGDIAPGDFVLLGGPELSIESVLPRKNCLIRTYRGQPKEMAANLDMLFLVSAVFPLFNTIFVDRVMAVCRLCNIPHALIINKTDLGLEAARVIARIYEPLGEPLLHTSAKTPEGLLPLHEMLARPELGIVALAGISGVGKSTILNCLVPGAKRKTAELSRKTGKGKQTTSQAVGYVYSGEGSSKSLIIDLPGLQNFGVTHIPKRDVAAGFQEIEAYGSACEFTDCLHVAEPNCAVKAAVEAGEIAPSRYASYLHMLDEIDAARLY